MIKTLSFQGFKSLQEIRNLDLGTVNVLIGANGSGKSNILEAIGVMGAAASGRIDDQTLLRRGVRPGGPALYKTSLAGSRLRRTISFEAMGKWGDEESTYRVSLDNPIDAPEKVWHYLSESLLRGQRKIVSFSPRGRSFVSGLPNLGPEAAKLKPYSGLTALVRGYEELTGAPASLVDHLSNFVIYSPTTQVLRGIQPDQEQRHPLGLFGGRLPEAVEDILEPGHHRFGSMDLDEVYALLDWVASLGVARPSRDLLSPSVPSARRIIRFTDKWMRESRNQLSGYDASEGALFVLFMLTLAMHPDTPAFCSVDNFDLAMHPRLARAVTRQFCRLVVEAGRGQQIILTTHNPLVLDGLNLRDERIRLFAVERSRSGATELFRVELSDAMLNAVEKGTPLSSLWVMGRLGGVPDIF